MENVRGKCWLLELRCTSWIGRYAKRQEHFNSNVRCLPLEVAISHYRKTVCSFRWYTHHNLLYIIRFVPSTPEVILQVWSAPRWNYINPLKPLLLEKCEMCKNVCLLWLKSWWPSPWRLFCILIRSTTKRVPMVSFFTTRKCECINYSNCGTSLNVTEVPALDLSGTNSILGASSESEVRFVCGSLSEVRRVTPILGCSKTNVKWLWIYIHSNKPETQTAVPKIGLSRQHRNPIGSYRVA